MCEFCENGGKLLNSDGNKSWLRVIKHLSKHFIIYGGVASQNSSAEINFCPICGRDLRREKMNEQVNHPSHYQKAGRKECIVEMEEKYGIPATIGFCLMNAYKYLYRAGDKADNSYEQDRNKAKWYFDYANKLIEKTDVEDCFKKNSILYLDIKGMLEN
jgi:hypothetical protein